MSSDKNLYKELVDSFLPKVQTRIQNEGFGKSIVVYTLLSPIHSAEYTHDGIEYKRYNFQDGRIINYIDFEETYRNSYIEYESEQMAYDILEGIKREIQLIIKDSIMKAIEGSNE